MGPLADTETAARPAARAARYWRAETAIFLGIWLTLMIVGRSKLFKDPGSLWHIVVGQRMLASGELIHTDPFSFTAAGKPWVPQSWLAECVLALIHRVSGLDGILLATVTLLACLYTWVAHRLLRAGLHPLLAVFFTALAILASSYHFHPRPHLMTIVLLGWTFAKLCDFEAGRIPLSRLFWLLPVFILWANLHGGMVGGIGTLTLAVAGWAIVYWFRWGGALVKSQQILWLGLLIVGCGLAAFVNPYGTALPRVWLSLIRSPVVPRVISEHLPLLYSGPVALTVFLLGFVYVSAFLGVLPRRVRVTWLLPLVWLALAWTSVRHGPLFAITAVIALADMFPHVRGAKWLARKGSVVFRLRTPDGTEARRGLDWRPMLIPSAVVLTAAVLQLAPCSVPVLGRDWAQLDRSKWPLELLPELRKLERSASSETPIFNDMLFGGFLIYHTPGLRVFIDDRCELYGDEGLIDYAHALRDDPARIEQWADQYGFEAALVQTSSSFDLYLQHASGWSMVCRTEAATLYRRTVQTALRTNSAIQEHTHP
jgi:hypothetical protein